MFSSISLIVGPAFVAPLLLAGLFACTTPLDEYRCTANNDCQREGETGQCEETEYCSFADPTCTGGRRYGSASGGESEQCVEFDRAADAGVADAMLPDGGFADANTNVTLPIDLASAGDFVILAKSAITNVQTSAVTGDIGISPATAAAITGFSLKADASNEFSTSLEITGRVYAPDYAPPTPAKMTSAILDMEAAYTAAAGRAADMSALGGVDIGGMTFERGVYKWDGPIEISSDVILTGSATDVWIFQIAGALSMTDAGKIVLAGDARAKNIFWQASGAVALQPGTHCEGAILTATSMVLDTGASVNGRLMAQIAVTLGGNSVVEPTP